MKINVFDIKFKTNPNQPIVMTKDPFVLEIPEGVDINWYIAKWFNDNYNVIPRFEWDFLNDDKTNKIIELAEEGVLSWEQIARECLQEMSEDDIADMARICGWIDNEDEKEED